MRDILSLEGLEAYLVGGCIRDSILGRPTRDIDLVLREPVEELAKRVADALGGSLVILGREHRTARVVLPPDAAPGSPWQIDLSPLTTDILQNLADRDFTIDAMAMELDILWSRGGATEVIDPFGGVGDLRARTIRAVGPDAFRMDPGRLLRALRLAAEMDFSVPPETQSLIRRDASLLVQVAPERVTADLCPILANKQSYRWLCLMEDLGLLQVLIPELEEGRGVDQPKEHSWDVYHHSLRTVEALDHLLGEWEGKGDEYIAALDWAGDYTAHFGEELPGLYPRRALVKLAGLLHDVGKPRTKTVEASGRMRFYGHSQVGAEMVRRIMRRLRFGRREVSLVETIVLHHLRPGLMSHDGQLPTLRAVYRFFRDTGDAAIDTLFVNLADYRAARGPLLQWEEWDRYAVVCRHILSTGLAREDSPPPRPLITGHDLIKEFRLSPGPLVGRLLEEVREARASGEIATREQALALASRSLGVHCEVR
ncbi:MAG: HD domain-containing protein [Dehalococcoidia bacterium]